PGCRRDPSARSRGGRRRARSAEGARAGCRVGPIARHAARVALSQRAARPGAVRRRPEILVHVGHDGSGGAGASGAAAATAVPTHHEGLREFVRLLEERGELRRIRQEVDPVLQITEISQRVMRAGGPALLFENVKGSRFPLLINTYATRRRMSWALGVRDLE